MQKGMRRWSDALRAWWPCHPRLRPPAEHRRLLADARVEHHGGLTALYLYGSPYQLGYEQGVLCRKQVLDYRKAAYEYVLPQIPTSRRLARPTLFHYASSYWPTIPPDLKEEMRGIADGAGVHPVEVLVSTAIWEIFLVSGCSEFTAAAPVTSDGEMIHAYNYDLMDPAHALIQPFVAVLFLRPIHGIPFFTVNTVGSVGANAGMNEEGLSVAWDNTNLRDDQLTRGISLPVVPFVITLRRLLQHARSLDEAVKIVTQTLPRPLGDIIIIGSAREARAVALETAGSAFAIREMQDGAVWSTNCFRSEKLAPHDLRGDGRALLEHEAWQRFPRYTAYTELFLQHRGRLTVSSAVSLLRDPYPREGRGYRHPNPGDRATICRDITSWSLVMEPGKGHLWISDTKTPGCQGRFLAFDLPGRQRLPDLDLPPTGYHSAVRAAEQFLAEDLEGAHVALDEAQARDGLSAPLSLMRAALLGLAHKEPEATQALRSIEIEYPDTPVAALAHAWSTGTAGGSPAAVPFPSAIRPLLQLKAGGCWPDRVARAGA